MAVEAFIGQGIKRFEKELKMIPLGNWKGSSKAKWSEIAGYGLNYSP